MISRKHIAILVLLIIWSHALAISPSACEKKVVDFTGKEICIPKQIDRIIITCYGGGSQEIALFMGADKIIAHPTNRPFETFLTIYPALKKVPTVGTFNDVNLETLLKLSPSMVFAGISSGPTNERIRSAGITVYTLGIGKHSISSLLEEFAHIGIILHQERKANTLIQYWKTTLLLIDSRLSHIAPSQRKKVFYTSSSGKIGAESPQNWGDDFIKSAGGINVAATLPFQGSVNTEILNVWNPDVIITTTNGKSGFKADTILEDPALSQLKAVRGHQVFQAPVGTFWWDRPSPESILGILWLSKILYPEELSDVDLKKETQRFYKQFYNYTLSDSEYRTFFH